MVIGIGLRKIAEDYIYFEERIHRDIASITLVNTGSIKVVRLDTIIAFILVELLYLIKYTIFIPSNSLQEVISRNNINFLSHYEEE